MRQNRIRRTSINAALLVSVVVAAIRDLATDDPTWDIVTLPVATALFLAVVWYVNKGDH